MSTRSSSRRLVAGARPPNHSDHAGYNDCRHPVCLGSCETRWARAVANREDDRPCLGRPHDVLACGEVIQMRC